MHKKILPIETIYRLQDDIQNNKTDTGHFQAITLLLNLICYDEYYENIIDAGDIVKDTDE